MECKTRHEEAKGAIIVSKCQLELPKKEEMQRFLAQQLKEVGCGE